MDKKVNEPSVQNYYPDYTLLTSEEDNSKIAIDIKTTYRNKDTDKFNFTLGGYTSFIRKGNETKNIVYPFNEYAEHWVIGFVYNRIAEKKSAAAHSYDCNEIFLSEEEFLEYWRGYGRTANQRENYKNYLEFRVFKQR